MKEKARISQFGAWARATGCLIMVVSSTKRDTSRGGLGARSITCYGAYETAKWI